MVLTTKSISQFLLTSPCGEMVRTLEPRELARAQGFGDSNQIPTNRGLAGKLIGNAAPVPLTTAAVGALLH